MATARFVQTGNTVDYTPDSPVSAGDVVVQNDLVGVAKLDIKAGQLGGLAVIGVFDFPKATGVDTAIEAGEEIFWDQTAQEATPDDTLPDIVYLGKAVADAGDDDETVRVRLSQ